MSTGAEKADDQDTIYFNYTPSWLRGWHEISQVVTEHTRAIPIQPWNTFHAQLKLL